jgi:chorismate mutase
MNLDQLRMEIDKIDTDIVKLIGTRFVLTRKIGEFKKNNAQAPIDSIREDDVLNKWSALSLKYNVDRNLSKLIIRAIIDRVVREHENTINR